MRYLYAPEATHPALSFAEGSGLQELARRSGPACLQGLTGSCGPALVLGDLKILQGTPAQHMHRHWHVPEQPGSRWLSMAKHAAAVGKSSSSNGLGLPMSSTGSSVKHSIECTKRPGVRQLHARTGWMWMCCMQRTMCSKGSHCAVSPGRASRAHLCSPHHLQNQIASSPWLEVSIAGPADVQS